MDVKVITDEINPEPAEVIAGAIVKLSQAAEAMLKAGLRHDTIVLLLHDRTKIARRDISRILNALPQLQQDYTTIRK